MVASIEYSMNFNGCKVNGSWSGRRVKCGTCQPQPVWLQSLRLKLDAQPILSGARYRMGPQPRGEGVFVHVACGDV